MTFLAGLIFLIGFVRELNLGWACVCRSIRFLKPDPDRVRLCETGIVRLAVADPRLASNTRVIPTAGPV